MASGHGGMQRGTHRGSLVASTAIGYRLASACGGVSGGMAEDMARFTGLAASKVIPIHNPIRALQETKSGSIATAHELRNTAGACIQIVSNLKPIKSHALVLRALARLPRPGTHLMLLGQGQDEAGLRALAAEFDIADRVIFARLQADCPALCATADLFILSSDHEGFGNVIVGALSGSRLSRPIAPPDRRRFLKAAAGAGLSRSTMPM